MFETKKDNSQPHVLDPVVDQAGDAPNRSEPSLGETRGATQAQPFSDLLPKSADAGSMSFGERMAMGSQSAADEPGLSTNPNAVPEEFERTAGEPAQAELAEEVQSMSDEYVQADPIQSDAGESQSFGGGSGSADAVIDESSDESMKRDDTPQFGLPVDTSKSSPKIGAILVANGNMTAEQVQAVLEQQEREPDARFGELAVRSRFVSQKDVDDALAAQFGFSSSSQVSHGLPEEIVTAHTPFSPFAEALRGLRSQLMLRWFDGSPQQCALAMTSVDRADGKSFITSNLGVVFSQLGEKTLIIDADLRNSTQHLKFGLQNKMGLSGVLSGRAGVEEILAVPGVNNLAVLPAGPIPPNPQELLGREDFSRFLAAMSNTFDVILVDTPSAQQASDAQVVAQRARAAVIVGRKDKTKSTEIGQLGAVMTSAGVKLLGATLNEY